MLAALFMLAACAAPRAAPVTYEDALVALPQEDCRGLLDTAETGPLAAAVRESLDYFAKLPPDTPVSFGRDVYTAAEMRGSMSAFYDFLQGAPPPAGLAEYVASNFQLYGAPGTGADGGVMYTGYYTPELMVSPVGDATFRYPIYAPPDDLVTVDLGLFRKKLAGESVAGIVKDGRLVPYYSRSEIDASGALSGRGLEIAWSADLTDVFFMQVQGSGVLVFPDGTKARANFAGTNGRAYRSIGRYLIEQGKADIGEMSLAFLRNYLKAHPDEARSIMDMNESYVFFEVDEAGPYGCLGVPVTAGRSIATDPAFYPQGALAFVRTETPVFSGHLDLFGWEPYSRFVLNQDRGGAIKGPGRADIYFGFGEPAQVRAGYMRHMGALYFLAPLKAPR